jgi:hypothetical protein
MTRYQTLVLGVIDGLGAVGFGWWQGSWGAGLWMGIVLLKITQGAVAVADYYSEKARKEAYAERYR